MTPQSDVQQEVQRLNEIVEERAKREGKTKAQVIYEQELRHNPDMSSHEKATWEDLVKQTENPEFGEFAAALTQGDPLAQQLMQAIAARSTDGRWASKLDMGSIWSVLKRMDTPVDDPREGIRHIEVMAELQRFLGHEDEAVKLIEGLRESIRLLALEQKHPIPAFDIPHYTCGVEGCRLRLNRYMNGDGTWKWVHGRTPPNGPHKVVQVRDEVLSARMACDFCARLDPEWALGADPFDSDAIGGVAGVVIRQSDAGWTACDWCYERINDGRMAEVTELAIERVLNDNFDPEGGPVPPVDERTRRALRDELQKMHSAFIQYRRPERDERIA